jgi:hypothetical protein
VTVTTGDEPVSFTETPIGPYFYPESIESEEVTSVAIDPPYIVFEEEINA